MKRSIEGADRHQVTWLPECLDDYVGEDNPVRIVDAFINELNLVVLGFDAAEPATTGRPGYHPRGPAQAVHPRLSQPDPVQSPAGTRGAARCELMWLTGRLTPDFKTIADFRRENGKGISNLCRSFIVLCRQMKLFSQA